MRSSFGRKAVYGLQININQTYRMVYLRLREIRVSQDEVQAKVHGRITTTKKRVLFLLQSNTCKIFRERERERGACLEKEEAEIRTHWCRRGSCGAHFLFFPPQSFNHRAIPLCLHHDLSTCINLKSVHV